MRLAGDDERLSPMAREALGYIVAQIHDIESRLKIFEQRILSLAKEDEVCRRLMTVQSIGPYIATAIAATVGDPRNFASGRHFAAWLGLTPKQHSTGGKEKLGGKQARRQLYPSVTHSWRSGDCGSCAERPDEKRLALRASESAAFQRRHRRLGKQDNSSRMGGHVDRASPSKGRLIARRQ